MMPSRLLLSLVTVTSVLLVLCALPSGARAQDDVPALRQARQAYQDGRFDEALQAVAEAAEGDALSREQVWELVLLRLRIHAAKRDGDAIERDLRWLAKLAPDRDLPEIVPPDIRDRFAQVAGTVDALELELEHEAVFGGVVLRAEATGTEPGLVRAVRIHARSPGGEWFEEEGEVMRVPTPAGTDVEHYAELVGIGGAVLRRVGSAEEPLRAQAAGRAPTTTGATGGEGSSPPTGTPEDADPETASWPIIVGVIAAVLAAGGAALALGLLLGGDDPEARTELGGPAIRW